MLAVQVQMIAGNIQCPEMFYGRPHCGFGCYKSAYSTSGLAWEMGLAELIFNDFCTSHIFSLKYILLEGTTQDLLCVCVMVLMKCAL